MCETVQYGEESAVVVHLVKMLGEEERKGRHWLTEEARERERERESREGREWRERVRRGRKGGREGGRGREGGEINIQWILARSLLSVSLSHEHPTKECN